jgi:hypothetical protein
LPAQNARTGRRNLITVRHISRCPGGEGSYGLNLWLLPDDPIYAPAFPSGNFFKKYSDAQGSVPLLGDSVWVGSWPFEADAVPDDITGQTGYPGYPHGEGFFMGRFCVAGIKKSSNVDSWTAASKGSRWKICGCKMASELQAESRCIIPWIWL